MLTRTLFTLTSVLALFLLLGCEREELSLASSDRAAPLTSLEATFAVEDADELQLSGLIAVSDEEILNDLEKDGKANLQKNGRSRVYTTVYTQTNEATGNYIVAYTSGPDGSLTELGRYATGGLGSGDGLGNQGAVHVTDSRYFLYAVNAGDHSVSAFLIHPDGTLYLLSVARLKGRRPVSVTSYRNLVYVVNAGTDDIEGLILGRWGVLRHLRGSRRPLSTTGTAPAQIAFKNNGRALLVTEKATQTLGGFAVTSDGTTTAGQFTAAANPTPFGFDFGWGGRAVVTEAVGGAAGASQVTAYRLTNSGTVYQLGESLALNATAACWAVLHPSNGLGYVTNTGSDEVSSLARQGNGMEIANAGRTTPAVSGPVDAAIDSRNGYLYILLGGNDRLATYHIGADGALHQIDEVGDLPATTNGLAVRSR